MKFVVLLGLILNVCCEIRIGGIFHLSGFGSHWGKSERDAAWLAFKRHPDVKFIAEDSKSDPKECVAAFRKLATYDKVQAILGPTWTACYFALGPLSDQYKIPIIAPSGADYTNQPVFAYRFGLFYRPQDLIKKVVDFIKKKEVKSVSIVYAQEPYFVQLMENLTSQLQKEKILLFKEKNFTGRAKFYDNFGKITSSGCC
ncbi:MAG: ABC transporter substrate-binding protein [Deltaproteobacteria bacterium]|nr:ABC transporter substrate-binding protein [Deltaproteobacteria bacterium]